MVKKIIKNYYSAHSPDVAGCVATGATIHEAYAK
jgi:predicted RNase H-like HicB family nuclease